MDGSTDWDGGCPLDHRFARRFTEVDERLMNARNQGRELIGRNLVSPNISSDDVAPAGRIGTEGDRQPRSQTAGEHRMLPRELVAAWVEAFNRHDPDEMAAFYAEHAVNHQVVREPVEGRAAIREMFASEFTKANMVCIVENIFEDDQWAILEWKDPLGLRGSGFFHVENDKIVFQRGYWDRLSFLRAHNLPVDRDI
jgi:SnoaL-like protein